MMGNHWFKVMLVAATLAVGPSAWASNLNEIDEDAYNTITSYEVSRLDDDGAVLDTQSFIVKPQDGATGVPELDEADLVLDKIINMGKKVWAIVEANRPIVNVAENSANALPAGTSSWLQLQGWQNPKATTYEISYKNGYGWKVVKFAYTVIYTAGGNVNGAGRYLSQVTVVPKLVDVSWGFKFNAQITIPNTVNVGSSASPIAGEQIDVRWRVSSVLKDISHVQSYFVRGDGPMIELN